MAGPEIYWQRSPDLVRMRTFGGRNPGGRGGLVDYPDKATVNKTPKYGGLYGQSARVITIAGVLYQWTGNAIQAISVGATDAAPTPPPATPTLSASPGVGQNTLNFSASPSGATPTLTATANGITVQLSISAAATSYTHSSLTPGVSVSYVLYETNSTGDSGTATASATPTGAAPSVPAAPTLSVSVVGSALRITLSAGSGLTSRALYRGGTLLTTLGGNVNSYDDSTVTTGTAYSYTAQDTNAQGQGALSAAAVGTVPVAVAPAAPTNFAAMAGNGSNALRWDTPPAGATINLSRTVGGTTTNFTPATGSTTFSDTGLTNGTLASYTLTFTANGLTSPAATTSATPAPTTNTFTTLATRAQQPTGLSSGTLQQDTSRIRMHAIRAVSNPQFEWVGFQGGPGNNDYYVSAALEVLSQTGTPTTYPVTFGGAASGKVPNNGRLTNDIPTGINIPLGATLFMKQHVIVPVSGQKWVVGHSGNASLGEGTLAVAQTLTLSAVDAPLGSVSLNLLNPTTKAVQSGQALLFGGVMVTTSAAVGAGVSALPVAPTSSVIPASTAASHYDPLTSAAVQANATLIAPIRMFGQAVGSPAATVILGTSIYAGYFDGQLNTNGSTTLLTGNHGWPRRALGTKRPVFNLARSGEKLSDLISGGAATTLLSNRLPYISTGDIVMLDYGTNDIAAPASRTVAAIQTDYQALIGILRGRGATVILSTILPRTTAADGLTPIAGFEAGTASNRAVLNAWIRANSSSLHDGYVEAANIVETAQDSGVWKTGTTYDGIHPSRAGHTLIADSITTAERTLIAAPTTPELSINGVVAQYLLDDTGSTLTDTGIYAAYPGSLGTAARRTGGGLTFGASNTATLPAGVTANLDQRTQGGYLLAFNVPATAPAANQTLLSATGLSVIYYGTGGAFPGKVAVFLTNGVAPGTSRNVLSIAALAAGDHAIEVGVDSATLYLDVDGAPNNSLSAPGAINVSGAVTLGGLDIHALQIVGDYRIQPRRDSAYKGLKAILNARAGVALP